MKVFEIYTANENGDKYKIGSTGNYLDAKRLIANREGHINSCNRVIKAYSYDKYIVNGRLYWIEW